MNLVTQLHDFLDQRDAQAGPFFLGEWLCSLDDLTFADLRTKTVLMQKSGGQAVADEVIELVVNLMAAELAKVEFDLKESKVATWVETLRLDLSLESFRRKGWITFARPLSIRPTVKVAMQLTPEGLRNADQLKKMR